MLCSYSLSGSNFSKGIQNHTDWFKDVALGNPSIDFLLFQISVIKLLSMYPHLNIHASTEEREKLKKVSLLFKKNRWKGWDVLGDLNAKVGREDIYHGLLVEHSLFEVSIYNKRRLVDSAAGRGYQQVVKSFPIRVYKSRSGFRPTRSQESRLNM